MPILTISHNIFLTKEERYAIYERHLIQAIGASIPVLITRGGNSKPAKEIFCKYFIINNGEKSKITILKNGYEIVIPPKKDNSWIKRLSNDNWRKMSEMGKEKWYAQHAGQSPENLLDLIDKGAGGYLSIICRTTVKKIDVLHFIEIKPMEVLLESLV